MEDILLHEGENTVGVAMVPKVQLVTARGCVRDPTTGIPGLPMLGVLVEFNGYEAFTSSDGWFAIDIPLRDYTVTFSKAGYTTQSRSVSAYRLKEGRYVSAFLYPV